MASSATRPASEYQARIDDAVRVTLEAHGGAPVSQATLAVDVRVLLGLEQHAETTLRRRCKEAVSRLCARGIPVISTSSGPGAGYRIARTPADLTQGRQYLVAQIRGIGRRLQAFDRAASERVEQLIMELSA